MSHLDRYSSSIQRLSGSFGDSFLSLHVEHTPGMHYARRLYGAAHEASGIYMANLM